MAPTVAIIGAGPSGIVAAKELKDEGFQPTIFELSSRIGGQWNSESSASGVWETMRTNTSSILTGFSSMRHVNGTPIFPRQQQIQQYLTNFCSEFGLLPCLKLNSKVISISRDAGGAGYDVSWKEEKGLFSHSFTHIVVASGRFNKPFLPVLKGVENCNIRIMHSMDYKGPEEFHGKRVLIVGSSISAYEVAGDIANDPRVKQVLSCCRKPRYVLHKAFRGIPTDSCCFTRLQALLRAECGEEAEAERLKEWVLKATGNPEKFGAPKPSDDILEAQITLGSVWLQQVADGRVRAFVGAISHVEKNVVCFTDGRREEVDIILYCTGFDVNLPFLSRDICNVLSVERNYVHLYEKTFHPDLPNMAFIGMFSQFGPYFPVIEIQSRWVAMVWTGKRPLPDLAEQRRSIENSARDFKERKEGVFHVNTLRFAELAGVTPPMDKPELVKPLFLGPLIPSQFRISGHGSFPDAKERFLQEADDYGDVPNGVLPESEIKALSALSWASKDVALRSAVEAMIASGSKAQGI